NDVVTATLEWEGPAGVVLRSLTGAQSLAKRQTVDGDRLTEELVAVDLTGFGPVNFDLLPFWDNDSEALSQEIDLLGSSRRWEWVAGLYYLRHENRNDFLEATGPAPVEQFEEQLENPSPETLPPFQTPLEFVEDRTVTRRDAALFGQATWRASGRLGLTFGGRLQDDRTTDESTQFWFVESTQRLDDSAFTWKLGADLALAEGQLLYALASTGRKGGGANPGAVTGGALDVPATFAPEEVTAFELGSRSRLLGGRAQLNATLFVYDYENYQFIQEDPVPFAAGTGNIPEVEIRGLETELSWRLNGELRLDGHLTLLDGEIESELFALDVRDFLESGFGRFTETGVEDRAGLRVDLAGNEPPKLADVTGRLLLTHSRQLAGGGWLTSRLDFVHRGEFQYRVFNNPAVDTVPAYDTVALFVGFEPARLPLAFELRATNVLDEDGVNSRFTNPFGLHSTSEELIPPRQVVGTVRYRF
ncbi:MAG: TonB-dependent receptor, partial [Thermoanaerobaculia bacterium]|nr:TonB-dependent receptor [Thermoanaerobaculia bacterium]